MYGFVIGLLNVLLILTSLFLICLVLIQRGKGGGLAGAFGGVGGSSAFGTKAGDIFTKITIVVASVWVVLSMLLVILNNQKPPGVFDDTPAGTSKEAPVSGTKGKGKTTTSGSASETEIPIPTPPSGTGAAPSSVPPPKSSLPEALPEAPSEPKTPAPKK